MVMHNAAHVAKYMMGNLLCVPLRQASQNAVLHGGRTAPVAATALLHAASSIPAAAATDAAADPPIRCGQGHASGANANGAAAAAKLQRQALAALQGATLARRVTCAGGRQCKGSTRAAATAPVKWGHRRLLLQDCRHRLRQLGRQDWQAAAGRVILLFKIHCCITFSFFPSLCFSINRRHENLQQDIYNRLSKCIVSTF